MLDTRRTILADSVDDGERLLMVSLKRIADAGADRLRRLPGMRMVTDRGSRLSAVVLALGLFSLAFAARLLLHAIEAQELPFITYFPAIVAAAYLCGPWPTLALIGASALIESYWTAGNVGQGAASAVIFAIAAAAVAAPALRVAKVNRTLQRRDDELLLINQELKHRMKNLFAVVNSVFQQTIRSGTPLAAMGRTIEGRIQAIAQAQDLLGVGPGTGSDLRALADAVLGPLRPADTRLAIDGASVNIPAEFTISLALILHELATNALKHGAWAGDKGRVALTWRLLPSRRLHVDWREIDGAPPKEQEREGFGSQVIRRALPEADVRHVIGPDGARCTIELAI